MYIGISLSLSLYVYIYIYIYIYIQCVDRGSWHSLWTLRESSPWLAFSLRVRVRFPNVQPGKMGPHPGALNFQKVTLRCR